MRAPPVNWRGPESLVLVAFAISIAIGFTWGLPGPDTWCADSISPRSCGLGAIVETYWPGHFHTYPPLHMALLTLLSLPWTGLAASRVGIHPDALGAELLKPLYMTGIEVGSRIVTGLMALGVAYNTMRLWRRMAGRRVGVGAGAVLVANATLVYYAHTGNLEVPYLFWVSWALVEIDRVATGEPRETQALMLATCAVLTKDQAAATLALPILLFVVILPWRTRRVPLLRSELRRGVLFSVVTYAAVSGALVNPWGFRRRLAVLFGPASQTWAGYPSTFAGVLALARDCILAVPHFGSWLLAALATVGIVLAAASTPRRLRMLLPLTAAVSFTLLFNLGARRSEDRFLLPQSVLLLPYASFALERTWTAFSHDREERRRPGAWWAPALVIGTGAAALVPALLGVVSLQATLHTDPRYTAEKFLATFPFGTPVEVYGSVKYLPRLPRGLVAIRPGVEPISERQLAAGVTELVDPALDPRRRAPALIVLATELSNMESTRTLKVAPPYGATAYNDPISRSFLRGLQEGSLGYVRVLRARCALPWPLECRQIHGSTGGELWIYAPAAGGVSP